MTISTLNKVCYGICLFCIIACLVLTLLLIWAEFDDELFQKLLMSVVALLPASAITLNINKIIQKPEKPD